MKLKQLRPNKDLSAGRLSRDVKLHLIDQIKSQNKTSNQVAQEHNLNAATVRQWLSRSHHNHYFNDNEGKSRLIDDIRINETILELKAKRKSQNLPDVEEYNEILLQKAIDTKVRRGGNDLPVNISSSTRKRVKLDLNASLTKGQVKTSARVKAEADPRNSYSEACMFNAFQAGIDPALIGNADATQYFSRFGNEAEQMLVHVKDDDVTPITMTEKFSGDMSIFVKSYTMGVAAGYMAPMVLVFSDPSMGEEDIRVKKIVGISHIPDAMKSGYVVFTKTRVANKAFIRWWLQYVV